MSSLTRPAKLSSTRFQTAEIRIVPQRRCLQSDYKSAYVFVSSRIYWKEANEDGSNEPQSALDFRKGDSLELVRLNDGRTWADVNECIMLDEYEGKNRVTAHGRLHGRERRNKLFIVRHVRIEIIANTREQLEVWAHKIRGLIAPWDLLVQSFKDVACGVLPSGGFKVKEFVVGLLGHGAHAEPPTMDMGVVEEKWNDIHRTWLLLLTPLGVRICLRAFRGRRVLPIAIAELSILLEHVSKCLTEILKPSCDVTETDIEFVFGALKQIMTTMGMAETQLLRSLGSQIINAGDVKEVERKVEDLVRTVTTVRALSKIYTMGEVYHSMVKHEIMDGKLFPQKEEREIWDDGPHHVRPPVSAFFSGRSMVLRTLRDKLEKWGSAVITQYGGVGKTELMIAVADQAERDGEVPGGVFWVTVDGSERDVIQSLAGLAERLVRKKIFDEDRQNANLVVAMLKQGLNDRNGRWLLCLDNADDYNLNYVLNEVCGIARGSLGNGWVLVTSRQGRPRVWSRMRRDQRLVLEPLCVEDAMVALWRRIRQVETSEADDHEVMRQIKELEMAEPSEYRALKELCGDDEGCSLGGLPLALVQAGSFIGRFEISLSQYLELFKSAIKEKEIEYIVDNAEDMRPIQDSQRSIFTTWKVNRRHLSEKAYAVLRTITMLEPSGVREGIVKEILKGVGLEEGRSVDAMFRNVVIQELVHGSSLIWHDEGKRDRQEGRTYKMHRLVRRIILNEMIRGSAAWNSSYNLALVTLYRAVETDLENEGRSFAELPDNFGNNHRENVAHALALVDLHALPPSGRVLEHGAKVEDIHRYSGLAMEFMGQTEQAIRVWERLVDILRHQQVANRCRKRDGSSSDKGHGPNREEEEKSRIADVYNSLGLALMKNGNFSDAASRHSQSLKIRREIYGMDMPHPDVAMSLNNLGSAYEGMGELNEAMEKYEQSLEMKHAIYGHNVPHPAIATSLNNLGNVYCQLGKLEKALESHEESLEMQLAIHGLNNSHPDIGISLSNLGTVYQRLGRLDEACEKHEQSLELYLGIHGADKPHPDIAMALNNLGTVYQRLGKLDKALENHEKSLEMVLAIHGPDKPHCDIATSLSNLGSVYQQMGKLDEALAMHERSLKMKRAIHGPNGRHADIATSLNNLGHLYELLGMLCRALEAHEQSLEIYLAIHGPNTPHAAIATSLCNLGSVLQELGKMGEALEMYRESLNMYLAIHGHTKPHSDIARVLNNIADVSLRQGNLLQAVTLFEQSIEMLEAVYGPGTAHREIAITLSNLGFVYQAQGKLDRALVTQERGLRMYRTIHKHDSLHPDIARSLRSVGLVCHEMRNLNRAAESYEQCLEVLRSVPSRNSLYPNMGAVLSNLVDVYDDQGRQGEASEIRKLITVTDTAAGLSSNSKSQK